MRESVIRDGSPSLRIAPAGDVIPMTPERWVEFFELVRDSRKIQQLYRATVDPRIRREMETIELQLDVQLGWIAKDLAAEADGKGGAA